jgi:hypothetical protein
MLLQTLSEVPGVSLALAASLLATVAVEVASDPPTARLMLLVATLVMVTGVLVTLVAMAVVM